MVGLLLLERGGRDMTKQVYNILSKDDSVDILKNGGIIYSIIISEKAINLQKLYEKMEISIEDEIVLDPSVEKIQETKKDVDRIYNNTVDFMTRLFESINERLKLLREKQFDSTFE